MRIRLNQGSDTWKSEGQGEEIHMDCWSSPNLIFGQIVLIFLQLLFVPLQIFNHQIFPCELVVVGEVIYDLMISQPDTWVLSNLPDLGLNKFLAVQVVAQ